MAQSSESTGIFLSVLAHFRDIRDRRHYVVSQASAARASSVAGYVFGNAWFLLTPLLEMLVYYLLVVVIFQRSMFGDAPPFLGLMTGLIHFWIFSRAVQGCVSSTVSRRGLMMQVNIAPVVFVATDFLNEMTKSLYYVPLFVGTFLFANYVPAPTVVFYPLVLLLLLVAAWSAGLLLSCVFVYFRDVRNGSQVILRLLLYACPIIYPLSFVPLDLVTTYMINPFAILFSLVHWSLLGLDAPTFGYITYAVFFVVFLFFLAHLTYERTHRHFTKVM